MTEYRLVGGENSVSLNMENTVGVTALDGLTTNETRTETFNPQLLVEWAEAVREAYGMRAEIVFTPGGPLVARKCGEDDPTVGIGVAHVETNDD